MAGAGVKVWVRGLFVSWQIQSITTDLGDPGHPGHPGHDGLDVLKQRFFLLFCVAGNEDGRY